MPEWYKVLISFFSIYGAKKSKFLLEDSNINFPACFYWNYFCSTLNFQFIITLNLV